MHIRPVQPTDRAEWLRMRLNLWGGTAEEHTQDLDAYFSSPQDGVTFVVERPAGGLCGFVEVSLRNYAEGCTTSPVAYIEGWYVDQDLRRREIGQPARPSRRGMGEASWAQEIASDTQIDNTVSFHAHTALGYVEVDRIVCFRKRLDERG